MTKIIKKVLFGIPVASLTLNQIPEVIRTLIKQRGKKTFFYINAHTINIANSNRQYKKVLQSATLVYSGGIGPVLASRLIGKPLKDRTPTPDFIFKIFSELQSTNMTIYFLGASQQSLKTAINYIHSKYPKLAIAGYHSGYFSAEEEKMIVKEINHLKPSILLVGMGSPKQELWIDAHFSTLEVKVFWAVGALFDVISKTLPRSPVWMQKLGLEWMYRLYQEPGRLWKRYTIGNIKFIISILTESIFKQKS